GELKVTSPPSLPLLPLAGGEARRGGCLNSDAHSLFGTCERQCRIWKCLCLSKAPLPAAQLRRVPSPRKRGEVEKLLEMVRFFLKPPALCAPHPSRRTGSPAAAGLDSPATSAPRTRDDRGRAAAAPAPPSRRNRRARRADRGTSR